MLFSSSRGLLADTIDDKLSLGVSQRRGMSGAEHF